MSQIKASTFTFLKDIKQNNNRDWFAENKHRYVDSFENIKEFFSALEVEMSKHDNVNPAKVFRIYRDVRFSKDKTPYKNSISGGFARDTAFLRGGYYVHLEPGNCFLAGGFWSPESKDLKLIREHIAADEQRFRKVLKGKKFKDTWGALTGDQLKTAPKGYPKDHSAIDLLRYKQLIVTKKMTNKDVQSKDFPKLASKHFKAVRPFFDYMSDILTHDLNGVSLLSK